MKRFGIQFSDPKGKTHYKRPIQEQQRQVFVCYEPETNTRFQRTLAYWSYCTLVFVTLCAFAPEVIRLLVKWVLAMIS